MALKDLTYADTPAPRELSRLAMAGFTLAILSWIFLLAGMSLDDRANGPDGYSGLSIVIWAAVVFLTASFTASMLAIGQIVQPRRHKCGLVPAGLGLFLNMATLFWFAVFTTRL